MTRGEKIERLLAVVQGELAKRIREDDGNNRDRAREIAKYWVGSWIPDGFDRRLAYCAVGAVWCCRGAGFDMPPATGCNYLAQWASHGGWSRCRAQLLPAGTRPQPGDLFLLDTGAPGVFNHIGFVLHAGATHFVSGEANTSPDATSNDARGALAGFWSRSRAIASTSGIIRLEPDPDPAAVAGVAP
mgnify:CR=1 FL=1